MEGQPVRPRSAAQRAWFLGIEFPGLADVVAEGGGDQQVAVVLKTGEEAPQLVGNSHGEASDAADVVGLGAVLERRGVGIAGAADVGDGAEGALGKGQRPGLDDPGGQIGIFDPLDFGQFGPHLRALRVVDGHGPLPGWG